MGENIRHHNPEDILRRPLTFARGRERHALVILLAGGLIGVSLMVQPTTANAVYGIDLSSASAEGPRLAPSPLSTPLPDVIDTSPSQHPSGKDRNNEPGNSYPQGKSGSNPDGNGVDKPYPAGGKLPQTQGEADFDGNNGCGNDNNFSDDNNGNCGGKGKPPPETATPGPTVTVVPDTSPTISPSVSPTVSPTGSPSPDSTSVATSTPGSTQREGGSSSISMQPGETSITALRTPTSILTPGVEFPKNLPKSGEENNLPWLTTIAAALTIAGLKARGSLRFR